MIIKFPTHILPALLALTPLAALAQHQSLADQLALPESDITNPQVRARVVEDTKTRSELRRANAREKARGLGLPLRIELSDGRIQEIADFDGDAPLYFSTDNANAAISTGANLVRTNHLTSGTDVTVGVWDGGSVRTSHQEFDTRASSLDGAASIDHATHVAGTIGARGTVASAKGMAPLARIDSYDWNNDLSEMTARAATAPGQTNKIYLSNHSYNFITGWNYVNNGTRVWEWYGNGTGSTSFEQDFGRYHTETRDLDALAYSAPYYLIFRSAGNERTDNPTTGDLVALSPGGSSVVSFDPNSHPTGDGQYLGGFETIGFAALAKNVVTVGSVADAVTSSLRDPSKANVSSFSSWGPTDDGRIKPDLVANGEALYSPVAGSNSAYANFWGTSMATPNATGSAALLIEHYANLFSNGALRAASLKGLLIHTADDRGNPGPDYKYGWGLVDSLEAADLISAHKDFPERQVLTEDELDNTHPIHSQSFVWDGSFPIKATLSWTDPAGNATSTSDLRSPRLINNLNLKIIAPGGSEYLPFVMPFVGTWTQASMNANATTGSNNTDNVEQILITAPATPGTYQVIVSHAGNLTNNTQPFSLILTGASSEEPPPPPLSITSISPQSGLQGPVTIDLTGTTFLANTTVTLTRNGHPDIPAATTQLIGSQLRCQFNLQSAAPGLWDIEASNSDLQTAALADAFTVIGSLWNENFDGSPSGWVTTSNTGSNSWALTTTSSHTPFTSYFIAATSAKTTTSLTSPAIPIPANASDLQLKFWHSHNLQNRQDGGRLEFSLNAGSWFEISSSGSGAAFASNGYNTTIQNTGKPSGRSAFAGLQAWSGNSGGFIETIVNLNDTAKYANSSLRIRWTLSTNDSTASPGWFVDSISLVGGGDLTNQPPAILTPPNTGSTETVTDLEGTVYEIIRGTTTNLLVSASDDAGEPNLTYTWSIASGSPAFISPNGNNPAQSTTITFENTGDYQLQVAIADLDGLTTVGSVNIRVLETPSDISLSPPNAIVPFAGTESFSATLLDQFGSPAITQPAAFTWDANGGGTVSPAGLFTANATGGPFVLSASSGSFTGTSSVTVTPASATVTLGNLTQEFDGNPRPVTTTTDPAGLSVAITYDGSTTPPVAPGTYAIEANITAPNYQGSSSGQLSVTGTPFANWQSDTFTPEQISSGEADPTADPDKDSLPNLIEYALGTSPLTPTAPLTATSDGEFLTLTFDHPLEITDINYGAQLSNLLNDWSPLALEVIGETNTTRTLRARTPIPAGADSLFIRLKLELQ